MTAPPEDLMKWPKKELCREVARLRAVLREHAERRHSDPREASTQDPLIEVDPDPHGHGNVLVDARGAVLLGNVDVALVDVKKPDEPARLLLSLGGRVNYASDTVTHAYLTNGDGAASLVSELIGIASRAAGSHGHDEAVMYAAEFKVALEHRMGELP